MILLPVALFLLHTGSDLPLPLWERGGVRGDMDQL